MSNLRRALDSLVVLLEDLGAEDEIWSLVNQASSALARRRSIHHGDAGGLPKP